MDWFAVSSSPSDTTSAVRSAMLFVVVGGSCGGVRKLTQVFLRVVDRDGGALSHDILAAQQGVTIQQDSPDRVGMNWLRLIRIVLGHSKGKKKRRARSGLDSTDTVASRSGSCTTAAPARHSTTADSTVIVR